MPWMPRYLYAAFQGWRYRHCIATYLKEPSHQITKITEITSEKLKSLNIEFLILDIDGVLTPHAEPLPDPTVIAWIKKMYQDLGPGKMAILSNKPMPARREFFRENCPTMHFISGVSKKPFPQGIQTAVEISGLTPQKVALIDDRLLTGMLAVCISGIQGIYVTSPLQNFKKRPMRESFFAVLRAVERWVYR